MTKRFIKILCFSCFCLLAAACGEKENVYFQTETSVMETQQKEEMSAADAIQVSEWDNTQTGNNAQPEKCFVYICGGGKTPGGF